MLSHSLLGLHLLSYCIGQMIRMSPGIIAQHLGYSLAESEIWFGCFCLSYCASHVFWGLLVDRHNSHRVAAVCYTLCLIACTLAMKYYDSNIVRLCYAVYGLGFSGIFPCIVAEVREISGNSHISNLYMSSAQLMCSLGSLATVISTYKEVQLACTVCLTLSQLCVLNAKQLPPRNRCPTRNNNTLILHGILAACLCTGSSVYTVFSNFILTSYPATTATLAGIMTSVGGLFGVVFVCFRYTRKRAYCGCAILALTSCILSLVIANTVLPIYALYTVCFIIGFTPTLRFLLFEAQQNSCTGVCIVNLFICLGGVMHVCIRRIPQYHTPRIVMLMSSGQFLLACIISVVLLWIQYWKEKSFS